MSAPSGGGGGVVVELPFDPLELALGLDEAEDRRAGEIGERARVPLAVGRAVDQAPPSVGGLLEPSPTERSVAARGGDQALEAGEPGNECLGEVAGRQRLERGRAQLVLGL